MNDEPRELVHRVSVDIGVPASALGFEGTDETRVLIQEVTGHLIVVPHVDGVNEYVIAVCGSEGWHTDVLIGPGKPVVARFAAVTPNGKVLGVQTAVVPASAQESPAVNGHTGLEMMPTAAEAGRK